MKISEYKAGQFQHQKDLSGFDLRFSSFLPHLINLEWNIDSPLIQTLLSEADLKLGELNAFSQLIPDIDFYIRMHQILEATQSNRIEGTQTSIEEALQKKEDLPPEKRDDWEEVHNYIEAMNQSIEDLKKLPISTRLICQSHKILLQGVRGRDKLPGEFRKSQNWIGGTSLKDAIFIPPPHTYVNELMSDLENFLHNKDIFVPHLIKIALIHYQFETIHPFLDGNGRMGRLLITLYLVANNLLNVPSLYLSDFFERNRTLYYDNLDRVRQLNDLQQWIKFFLIGVKETAENSINIFKNIIKLKEKTENKIVTSINNKAKVKKSLELLHYLYKNPFVSINGVSLILDISIPTAIRFITDFQSIGILEEITNLKRNRMFVFLDYYKLFPETTYKTQKMLI